MNYKELPENTSKKSNTMKKWLIPIAVIVLLGLWAMSVNNTAVSLKESATKTWGDVESSYQRRSDT